MHADTVAPATSSYTGKASKTERWKTRMNAKHKNDHVQQTRTNLHIQNIHTHTRTRMHFICICLIRFINNFLFITFGKLIMNFTDLWFSLSCAVLCSSGLDRLRWRPSSDSFINKSNTHTNTNTQRDSLHCGHVRRAQYCIILLLFLHKLIYFLCERYDFMMKRWKPQCNNSNKIKYTAFLHAKMYLDSFSVWSLVTTILDVYTLHTFQVGTTWKRN